MRDHAKLRAFQLADEFVLKVYGATRVFPREEQFGLTSQIRRAVISVASNIVEGCARQSQNDYLRFLDIAYGSLKEVEYQLSIALRLGYLNREAHAPIEAAASETARVLGSLILSYQRDR